MSVMELAEVVNPHFAVPVVGVVLCAVLVFAFGFKSSVQPPSFDFENKQRNRPKPSKKTKKPQSNGHVAAVEPGAAPATKPASPKTTSTPKSSPADNTPKTKSKKSATTPKAGVSDGTPITKIPKVKEEQDSGEWVTAKTRKRKPKKEESKKDDGSDSSPEVNKNEASPEPEAKVELVSAPETKTEAPAPAPEAPLEKRPSKKERRKKDGSDKAAIPSTQEAAPAPIPEPEPEPERKEVVEPEVVAVEEIISLDDEKSKPSPKKSKKKKGKSAIPEVPQVQDDVAPIPEPVDTKVEEKDPIQAALEDAAADDDTLPATIPSDDKAESNDMEDGALDLKDATRSPKKKKKSKDSREKYPEVAATPVLEPVKSEVEAAASPAQPSIEASNDGSSTLVDDAEVSTDAQASDTTSLEGAKSSKSEQSPVSFDELGGWQEAKPVKRKKRVRRDN